MRDTPKLILDYVYEHEAAQPYKVFLASYEQSGAVLWA